MSIGRLADAAWSLDVKDPREWEGWRTVARKPSADACKTFARHRHFHGGQGVPSFRIYDPMGRLFLTDSGRGHRMAWKDGGLYSRERMAEADAYFAKHTQEDLP